MSVDTESYEQIHNDLWNNAFKVSATFSGSGQRSTHAKVCQYDRTTSSRTQADTMKNSCIYQ